MPPRAAGAAAERPAPKLSSIGQVLNRLSSDFPDLAPSKLRFLEEQGLVQPQRTEAGYRKFTEDDIQRLRFILSLQRDHYLPLKVIREYLDEIDRGGSPTLPGLVAPADHLALQRTSRWLNRAQLLAETGVGAQLLTECVKGGLIPATNRYSERDATVLTAVHRLREFGIEPRHLRGIKAAADREAGLIDSVVAPEGRSGDEERRARAASDASTIADLLLSIHAQLLGEATGRLEP